MAEKHWKAGEPKGDPARHLSGEVLETRLRERPIDALEAGRVSLIVRRQGDGTRETLERALLSREEGVPATIGTSAPRVIPRPSSRSCRLPSHA